MPISFDPFWYTPDNNNGAEINEILTILATAQRLGTGDAGLLAALSTNSSAVTVLKGIHGMANTTDLHITVDYCGAAWHVNLLGTASGGRAGYRVKNVTQRRQ